MISDFIPARQAFGASQWRTQAPQSNALTAMASGNPVAAAYNEMFGGAGSEGGAGVSSGVSSGVSEGRSVSTKSGRASDYDYSTGTGAASAAGKVASVFGAPMGTGLALSALGVGFDQYEANKQLARAQTPQLGFGDYLSSLANSATFGMLGTNVNTAFDNAIQSHWGPMGFDPMASYGYANFDPFGAMGFADPVGAGEDAFGGWGGYEGQANIGPGADYESDPSTSDDFGGWGGYDGDMNDGPGADAEGDGW